jgi:uncharacterized protein (DUF58 family)
VAEPVRTRRLPLTARGRAVLGAAVVLLVTGWLLGYLELVVFAVAAAVAVAVGLVSLARRPQLEVFREIHPDRVSAGELAIGRVRVRNTGARSTRAFVALERYGAQLVDVEIPKLEPGQRRSVTYRLPTARRGVVAVGPLAMGRSDVLGLVTGEQDHGEVITLWVHPRVRSMVPLPASMTRSLEGPTSDTAPSGTVTFHALREYVLGDDLRHVHWRSSAHTGELMVKHYVDTSLPDTTVVLDTTRQSHDDASFEAAIEVAASITVASTSRHFPLELRTTGGLEVSSKGGGNAAQETLDQFALIEPDEGSLDDLLRTLGRSRGGTALVVVTSAPGPGSLASLATLGRRFGVVVLVDLHPDPSRPLPSLPGVTVVSGASADDVAATWNRTFAR